MNRNSSIASAAVSDDVLAEIYHTQHSEPSNKEDQTTDDSGWMQKREIHQVKNEAHRPNLGGVNLESKDIIVTYSKKSYCFHVCRLKASYEPSTTSVRW